MINKETIEKIFAASRIEEVVGDFIHLRRRGVNLIACCPFHEEKTPSFYVSPTKEIFKCFGCGKAGNSVGFIMEHESMSYPEALRYLADKYHILIEEKEQSEEERQLETDREKIFALLAAAQKHYFEFLNETDKGKAIGLSYFKERGLRQKSIEEYGLGFAPPQRDYITQWAKDNGYDEELVVKAGLGFKTDDGAVLDRFHDRVMFPIRTLSGKVAGFGGRILTSNPKEAKYINSPETEVYNKSKILFGLYEAKKSIRQMDVCVLVEGYMDVLSLAQAGITYVAASSGTSLTVEQVKQIKRFTENIYLFYDGDDAGQKAANRAIDLILEEGLNVRIANLSKTEDPDSFAREGEKDKEEIEKWMLTNTLGFVEFKYRFLGGDTITEPAKKAELIREIVKAISLCGDSLKRNLYLKEAEKFLGIEEQVLHDELRRFSLNKFRKENAPDSVDISETPAVKQKSREIVSIEEQEKKVIREMILHGGKMLGIDTVAKYIVDELFDVGWKNEFCHRIFNEFKLASMSFREPPDTSYFLQDEDLAFQNFVTHLVADHLSLDSGWTKITEKRLLTPTENYKVEVISSMNYIKLRKIEDLLQQNSEKLRFAPTEEEEMNLLIQRNTLLSIKMNICKDLGIVVS